jgi:pSer/pThr/pTyr-binding forkhead associated (FHA) protein
MPRHYRLRPQEKQHEIIVGRGSGGTLKPDVDLSPYGATELGVSRLHLSIRYNERYRTLSAADMGSSNGTTINGQRLHPDEKRVLRHGDEVRLGKLTLIVYFYRPKLSTT